MKFCLNSWIQHWASKNSVKLVEHKHHWFGGGPYRRTFFFMFPVYRITAISEDSSEKKGWVWLSSDFFFFGKGSVTWDHPQ